MASFAGDFRDRLVRFYECYQPEKLDDVDKLLTKAAGKEEQLFRMLVKKYGPEPDDDDDEEEEDVEAEEEEGEEGEEASDYRLRLVRFYECYQPEKLEEVDALLVKAAGKEERLFKMLVKKYGPEPDDDDDDDDEEEDYDYKRLERFYKKYQPEKLEDCDFLDNLLTKQRAKAGGNVEPLFKMLVKKYGAEPPDEEEEAEIAQAEAAREAALEEAAEKAAAAAANSPFRQVSYCPVSGQF